MQNNIGEARRSYALMAGKFTQDDAAAFFGVAASTYKGWEQGVGKLNGEILCKIADKYGCSTDYLLCRTNDPAPYRPVTRSSAIQEDEERLLEAYRSCPARGRAAILANAEAMADRGMAKNMDARPAAEAIGA